MLVTTSNAVTVLLPLRGGGASLLNPLIAVGKGYTDALITAPLATNMVTSATLAVLSDFISQKLASSSREDDSTYDIPRSLWMIPYGAVISGYILYYWFGLLATLFPDARFSLLEMVKKLVVNQLVLSPALASFFFLFLIFTRTAPFVRMTGEKWAAYKKKMAADLLPTLVRGNIYWPVVQTINFQFLPPKLTVFWTNLCFVFWTTYLCLVGNRSPTT